MCGAKRKPINQSPVDQNTLTHDVCSFVLRRCSDVAKPDVCDVTVRPRSALCGRWVSMCRLWRYTDVRWSSGLHQSTAEAGRSAVSPRHTPVPSTCRYTLYYAWANRDYSQDQT